MAKVKVRANRTFSTRDLQRFDASLVSKKPVLQEGEEVYVSEDALRFLNSYRQPLVTKVEDKKPGSDRKTKTEEASQTKKKKEKGGDED